MRINLDAANSSGYILVILLFAYGYDWIMVLRN